MRDSTEHRFMPLADGVAEQRLGHDVPDPGEVFELGSHAKLTMAWDSTSSDVRFVLAYDNLIVAMLVRGQRDQTWVAIIPELDPDGVARSTEKCSTEYQALEMLPEMYGNLREDQALAINITDGPSYDAAL